MKHDRILKAQSICKKIISEYILENLSAEDSIKHSIITVTEIRLASELSYLDVYVSCLKSEDSLTKTLSEYSYDIEKLLRKKIDFLRVPKVRFRYDASGKDSFDIYSKIQEISK